MTWYSAFLLVLWLLSMFSHDGGTRNLGWIFFGIAVVATAIRIRMKK